MDWVSFGYVGGWHVCNVMRVNITEAEVYIGPLLLTWFNFNPVPSKVWDEVTYPFLNFNGATVEV